MRATNDQIVLDYSACSIIHQTPKAACLSILYRLGQDHTGKHAYACMCQVGKYCIPSTPTNNPGLNQQNRDDTEPRHQSYDEDKNSPQ